MREGQIKRGVDKEREAYRERRINKEVDRDGKEMETGRQRERWGMYCDRDGKRKNRRESDCGKMKRCRRAEFGG